MTALRTLLVLIVMAVSAVPAHADIKIDVSENNIQVTTGFNGTSITVFGTHEGQGDVILVIEGPAKNFTVRKKGNTLGLWTNVDSIKFNDAPGYYEISATRDPLLIASGDVLAAQHIGIDNVPILAKRKSNSVRTQAFRDAFLQGQKDDGLYIFETKPLTYVTPTLFKARFTLPAHVPSGRYGVYAYLFQDGQMVQEDQTRFDVRPVGVSADLRFFAHEHALVYGLTAVMIAVFAGWLATVLLKRD